MRDYELVMVLSPEVTEDGVVGVVDRVNQFISQRGGTVSNQERLGVKTLAYPIQKYREGNYVLTQFAFAPNSTKELVASLRLWTELLRYLLVKKET